MAQPTAYIPDTNFIASESTLPEIPGQELDAEFGALEITIDEIRRNLALIQRDDGRLANVSVGLDQLAPDVGVLPLNGATSWVTAHVYEAQDYVFELATLYRCLINHTSGVFATDLAALKWVAVSDDFFFYQRPETGSVPLSIPQIMRQTARVTEFVGLGDDTANVTTAFQAALNAGLTELVLPGNRQYRVTGLTINSPIRLIGETDAIIKIIDGVAHRIVVNANNVHFDGEGTIDLQNGAGFACEPIFIDGGTVAKTGFVVDGWTIKNFGANGYGIHLEDVGDYTIRRCKFMGAAVSANCIASYHTNKNVADINIDDNYHDSTSVGSTFALFVPAVASSRVLKNVRITRNRQIGVPGGDPLTAPEHSLLTFLTGAVDTGIFEGALISGNYCQDINFPYSTGALSNASVCNNVAINGTGDGYCWEFGNGRNVAVTGNSLDGNIGGATTGEIMILNNCQGMTVTGNSIKNRNTNAGAIGFTSLTSGAGLGRRNVFVGNNVNVAGGTAVYVSNDNILVDGNNLEGNTTAATGINLNTGSGRIVGRANMINGFTTNITNINATDVVDIQGGGNKQVATNFAKTSDTTLANVTGLSVNVTGGKTYSFEADLLTTSDVAGGVKVAIAGTATATSIRYEATVFNAAALALQSRATALAAALGVTAVTVATVRIAGTITVNAAGTLTVQFAQNASNGAASNVLTGSSFKVWED